MDFQKQHLIHQDLEKAQDLLKLEEDLRLLLDQKLEGKDHLEVLNLACGRADETGVLASLLSEKAESVHLQGLELREREVQGANDLWKPSISSLSEGSAVKVDFQVGMGDKLDQFRQLEDPDLLFIRHQNYWFHPQKWKTLYDKALNKLKKDGVMVITSYFDEEHEMARRVLLHLGAVEVSHRFNPSARIVKDSPKVAKSVDRHISVFMKKDG